MDVFDKLFKQSKTSKVSSRKNNSQWMKNASNSIKRSAFDVIREYVPATMDTASSVMDMKNDLRETLLNTKKVGITKAGSLMSLGKTIWKNSLEDLKSGNFYNQERLSEADSAMFGDMGLDDLDKALDEDFDFGEDNFDDNFNFETESSDGQSSVTMKHESSSGNELTQINVETNLGPDSTLVRATQAQTGTTIRVSQELANISINNTKIMMSQLSRISTVLEGQLSAINDNVGSIATVISENMTSHYSVANQYYQDSLTIFGNMNDTLTKMSETLTKFMSTNQTDSEVDVYGESKYADLFSSSGGFNLTEYFKFVKKQSKDALAMSPIGMVTSMFDMMKNTGISLTSDVEASPISTMMKSVMHSLIPNVVKKSVEGFDKQLKETIKTGLFKVGGLSDSMNPVLQFIGNMFGIQAKKYNVDKGNYNKGPMAWNGIAHRTLVDVIPTYLSQIAAALTGTEQKVFDYDRGEYHSLNEIREENTRTERNRELSPFFDIRQEFSHFLRNFSIDSDTDTKYRNTFDDYLTKIAGGRGHKTFNDFSQLTDDVDGDETMAKLIQKFMRYAPKHMVTAAYGSNALESYEEISKYHKQVEADPVRYNAHYINNGMDAVSKDQTGLLFGNKKDKFGYDNLFYLRKLLQTVNTVVPVRIINQGAEFNDSILHLIGGGSTSNPTIDHNDSDSGDSSNQEEETTPFIRHGLSLDDLNLSTEELRQKIRERTSHQWFTDDEDLEELEDDENKPTILKILDRVKIKETSNVYKFAQNLVKFKKGATNKTAGIFDTMSSLMFRLLFGDEEDGSGAGMRGVVTAVVDKVRFQMRKFGDFIDDRVIGKINESLFGDDGLITKMKESESVKKVKETFTKIKTKGTEFLFGEKGEDGKRKGGLFSETLNSLSEMGKSTKNFIFKDKDGVVSNVKSMFKSVTTSIKKAVGVESDEEKPKTSIAEKLSSGASDFLTHIKRRGSEWVDLLFGKNKKLDENGNPLPEVVSGFTEGFDTKLFKADMKGKKGKIGASATLGLLGSFFLPGGPITGALLGAATGIVSESTQLKELLFGKLDETTGERADTGIISKQFQNFFKDNKVGMSVGASTGVLASIGILPSFFIPGGPIGGALLGTAISMVHKSGAFNELIYGKDGSADNVTGGITKFIKDHYKKDGNIKSTFMDAGMGAGVGLLGSFFLPGGPITGALLGAATNIAINTDKFKDLMFGEKELDENGNETGKRKGGVFGKFTSYIGDKVLLPLTKTAKKTQIKMLDFFEENVVNVLKVSIKPFQIAGKNFIDGVHETIDGLKQSFRERVTKPIGDSVEKHILSPMRNTFKKIFGGLGKIVGSFISAPFKVLFGAASALNKDQVKKGQSNYNIDEALKTENAISKSKKRHRLREVDREYKKKTWKDFFGRNGVRSEETTPDQEEQTTIATHTGPDDDHPMGQSAYSDEEWKDIIAERSETSKEQYQRDQATTISTSSSASSDKNSQSTSPTSESETKIADVSSGNSSVSTSSTMASDSSGNNSTVGGIPVDGLTQLSSYNENEEKKSTFMDTVKEKLGNITDLFSKFVDSIHPKAESKSNATQITVSTSALSDSQTKENQQLSGSSSGQNSVGAKGKSPIQVDIHKIASSVDGQLNGVGYNVNKILRVLLKKNEMSEEEVEGENNKKYSRGGKLKRFLMKPFKWLATPFTMLKGAVSGMKKAVKDTVKSTISGVTTMAKGILSLPKHIFKFGWTAVKGFGKGLLGLAKGVGKTISTGLNAAGNFIVGAANGFGKAIGAASEGFGKLIGGAFSGFANLLQGVGLIGKELAPYIAKGIVKVFKLPGKLISGTKNVFSKLFKRKHGKGKDGGGTARHVIVDAYLEKNEILSQLKAIEFAIIHGAPMDGEGPKYKGRTTIPVNEPGEEDNGTRMSMPMNLQMFANHRATEDNGNELPDLSRAKSQEEEDAQLQTRIASGSSSEQRERFEAEDTEKEERSWREKIVSLFHRSNDTQEKRRFDWSSIFSKKGLITGALIAALPLIIKHLPQIFNALKSIGSLVGDALGNFLKNLDNQGGVAGLVNGAGEQVRSVTDAVGVTKREEYVIGDNGQILTDENGNMVTEVKNDGPLKRVKEFFTPTETKIDHDTGIAYQENQYDAVSKGKLHWARGRVGKTLRKFNLDHKAAAYLVNEGIDNPYLRFKANPAIKKAEKKAAKKAARAERKAAKLAKRAAKNGARAELKTAIKTSIKNTKVGGKAAELVSGVTTKVKGAKVAGKELASNTIEKIIKYGDDALKFLTGKLTTFAKKYVKDGSKLDDIIKVVTKAFKKVFKPSTITKFMPKFSKVLGKIAAMATTVATSEVFWGITGAVEGATNAAYTFEVDDSAVDGKMRAIASLFRALLATSFGSWVDIVDSIFYEISGFSIVNWVAKHLYICISGGSESEDAKKLAQAQDDFDKAYDAYLNEEYNAYVANQERNGEAAMSLEEFKGSNIATSRQEFNSEKNKTWYKRTWDFFHDGKTKQLNKMGWDIIKKDVKKGDFSGFSHKNFELGRDYFFKNAFGWDLSDSKLLHPSQWFKKDTNQEQSGGNGTGNETTVKQPGTKVNGFTYYSQNDSSLKDQPYNESNGTPGTMGQRGCGPTAMSMVASEVTGNKYDPLSMAKLAESNGYSTDVGTTTGYFGNVGTQLGMSVAQGQANPASIRNSLVNGNPIILQGAGGSNSPYTEAGHYVVGVGMQGDKVLVNDPRGAQYSKAYSMGDLMNGAQGMWSFSDKSKGGFGPTQEELKTNATGETGTSVSTSGAEDAEKALVNAMYSVKDKLAYSMTGPRNPDKGSADCSSTVKWAYQKTVGIDPGGNTREQIKSANGVNVDSYNGGPPNEANLRPGDLLFYGKNGVHDPSGVSHVEMYVGNNKLMGHGGGAHGEVPGPTEKEMSSYRVNGYIGAKRFIGDTTSVSNNFAGAMTGAASTMASNLTSQTGEAASGSSDTSSFSLSNLFSGAIDAISRGISNFFGINQSSTSTTSGSTTTTEDPSFVGTGAVSMSNVTPDTAAKSIWTELLQKGYTKAGIAGLLGNIHKESGLKPNNLQDSGNKKLGLSDEEYTNQVDSGTYKNFVGDNIGYGLAQWTSSGRKQGLFNLAKSRGTSISDPATQADFLYQELDSGYKGVSDVLKTTESVYDAAKVVCTDFEKPKMKDSPAEQQERANYGQSYYEKLVNYQPGNNTTMPASQVNYVGETGSFSGVTGGNGSGTTTHGTSRGIYGGKGIDTISPNQSVRYIEPPKYNNILPNNLQLDGLGEVVQCLNTMIQYMKDTSIGINQLNQKEFGGNSVNYVNTPSYTNNSIASGGGQQQSRDTSNYELGRQIAQGQLA